MIAELDSIVEFYSRTVTQNSTGQEVETYTASFKEWAKVETIAAAENVQSDHQSHFKKLKITTRYRSNVYLTMQIKAQGEMYDIIAVNQATKKGYSIKNKLLEIIADINE